MSAYAVFSSVGTWVTVKPGSILPVKIIRVDGTVTAVAKFTGSPVITGGSTVTPTLLREGAAAAGATSKGGATSISGTQNTFIGSSTSGWTPATSLILAAGSSSIFAVAIAGGGSGTAIYFDELEIQPGF